MKNVIVVGGGGHAHVVIDILKKCNTYCIVGYSDIYDKGKINGIPYIGTDKEIKNKGINHLVFGMGFINNFKKKNNLIRYFVDQDYRFPIVVSATATVNSNVIIDKGSLVADNCILNNGLQICEFCLINTGTIIEHNTIIGNNSIVGPGTTICGDVIIGSNTLIGPGVTIINDIRISDNVIIGAGTVVVKDVLEPGVYVGNPARKVKNHENF